jgi:Arc/MetJ-type ribon-helix-helix transcriptional regulator
MNQSDHGRLTPDTDARVTIRIPSDLIDKIGLTVKDGTVANPSVAIREAVREWEPQEVTSHEPDTR